MQSPAFSKFENAKKIKADFETMLVMDANIGRNLKTLRNEQNITQKDLADKLNISFKTISHWEVGYTEPSIELLKSLKKLLNVSWEDLLD